MHSPIVVNEDDDRFSIAESSTPGAGDGLFARVPLEKGARLRVVGVRVAPNSVADRCTRYADEHKYRVGDSLLIPLGYGAMANHSSTPNVAKVVDGHDVYLQALRDIEAGEELCFAYDAYALERFGIPTT
ncbi:MAG: SET domain-containing protein-lysine N-methyltransferase [Luteitalea sp.]|nr:SET domain-containing protein-lysine N-methyltransferase [Luteitalea sp.]